MTRNAEQDRMARRNGTSTAPEAPYASSGLGELLAPERAAVERAQRQVYHDDANDQLLNAGHNAQRAHQSGHLNNEADQEEQNEDEISERHRLIASGTRKSSLLRAKRPLVEWEANQRGDFDHHQKRMASEWTAVRWRPSSRLVLLAVLLIGIAGLMFMLSALIKDVELENTVTRQQALEQLTRQLDERHRDQLEREQRARWLVSSPKCHIPLLEPWDRSIEGFVRRRPPMNCTALLDDIISGRSTLGAKNWTGLFPISMSYVHSNRLYFTESALELGALSSPLITGQCCLKRLARKLENDNELEPSTTCELIYAQGLQVNSSLVEVICAAWNYSNVHAFFVPNQEEERALAKVASERLSAAGDFYSVLMVGVDTISRLNGQRQLNNTLAALRDLYGALDFAGYNKVGENTFPNLIPLLTGLTPHQLDQVQCWNAASYDENESGDEYLDNCKFLWNYYQQAGYLTYYGEDWPQASTFNYLKPGFKYEPTHFYGRPFTLARDHLIFPRWNGSGCASCQLDKPLVEVDIGNLRSFIESKASSKLPYFAMHWFNCPQHDDLNGASTVDHVFERFFRDLRHRLEADRTFVVFFSDHGYRWNDFVSTRIGHYESSLPMLTIAPPRAFIERHPDLYEHLKSHQNALLTPFDLFKTLIHLRDLSSGRFETRPRRQVFEMDTMRLSGTHNMATLDESSEPPTPSPEAAETTIEQLKPVDGTSFKQKFSTISLFEAHSPEQLDRSCIDAGIPDNYCVCHQYEPVATDGDDVRGAAYYLVYVHLAAQLRDHLDICQPLDLERVHHAEMFDLANSTNTKEKTRRKRASQQAKVVSEQKPRSKTPLLTSAKPAGHLHGPSDNQNRHDYLPEREFNVMFSTKPGGGLFQEVVRFYGLNMTNCKLEVAKTRKVVEDEWAKAEEKRESVLTMNDVCDFSVHSESLSRFNLYRDQSKCVNNNIELKKICYCKDLRE